MSDNEEPELDATINSHSKRKRTPDPELEIDLTLPEPVSKKAKRLEKKSSSRKSHPSKPPAKSPEYNQHNSRDDLADLTFPPTTPNRTKAQPQQTTNKRTDHSIWIGNLSFTSTREKLYDFLITQAGIKAQEITRLHLPTTPTQAGKTQNKGFAYIDFLSEEALTKALLLSEKLLDGRRVLIKHAKSFEGRPAKTSTATTESTQSRNGNGEKKTISSSKRVFVGNLGFDVTKEELAEHFGRAGEVEEAFVATFEDSGKCKGFGWVRFADVEAAAAAVKGYVFEEVGGSDDETSPEEDGVDGEERRVVDGHGNKTKKQKRRHLLNRLHGRQLRCEFAEDAQTRYKKRYGKDSKPDRQNQDHSRGDAQGLSNGTNAVDDDEMVTFITEPPAAGRDEKTARPLRKPTKDQRREERRKRHEKLDASRRDRGRLNRASGAIDTSTTGSGKKVTFDD